ncbi:MAG: hypothetical protein OXE50_06740 [Chloroflexi bacterium]|nr:hypothetical protein [Chloroflexota bacterium]
MVIQTGGGQRALRRAAKALAGVVRRDSAMDVDKWGLWLTSDDMDADLAAIEAKETK